MSEVTGLQNPPRTHKPWVITRENGQKCSKTRVLPTPLEPCTEGHKASKPSREPKIVGYNPRKRPEMLEITSFDNAARVVCRGSQGIKILSGQKIVGYNPRKWPEMLESTSFVDAARVVCRGHKASKPSRDPKIVGYNPRKRPEMLEITSFDGAARVLCRGSQGIKILPGPKSLVITHENGQKCSKSRVLSTLLESCVGGHRASKSSQDP